MFQQQLAAVELLVSAPAFDVPPTTTYECFGPWKLPLAHGNLHSFQPEGDIKCLV